MDTENVSSYICIIFVCEEFNNDFVQVQMRILMMKKDKQF